MCLIPFFKKSTWRSDIAWKMNRTIANKKKIREIPSNSLNYFVTQFLVWIFLCWSWFLGNFSTQRFTKNWTSDTFLSKFFIFWISFGIRSVCQYCGEHFGVRNKLPKLSTWFSYRWVILGPSQSRTVYFNMIPTPIYTIGKGHEIYGETMRSQYFCIKKYSQP